MCSGLVLLFAFSMPAAAQEKPRPIREKETRPNVLVVLMDDLGWRDLGCYGGRFIDTPAADRLAREGMRFTDAYAAAPVCSPTRASLLTGQYPGRIGMYEVIQLRDRPYAKLSSPPLERNCPSRWKRCRDLEPSGIRVRVGRQVARGADARRGRIRSDCRETRRSRIGGTGRAQSAEADRQVHGPGPAIPPRSSRPAVSVVSESSRGSRAAGSAIRVDREVPGQSRRNRGVRHSSDLRGDDRDGRRIAGAGVGGT
jgi:hypothetical protein